MRANPLPLFAALVVCFSTTIALAENWPTWRGPDGQGHSAEKDLPTRWSPTENVRWKTPLPDGGNSTPVVWGERVFVTQASEKGRRRALMCFARADGHLLWQKETLHEEAEPTHGTNPYCSASPVTDGERVVASFGSAGMVCYDLDGHTLWRRGLGDLHHIWGNASSPVLHGELCILWCGPGERQFVLAVNKRSGEVVWTRDVPGGKYGRDSKEWLGSWATPLVIRVEDHDELVVPAPRQLKAFDPLTGAELWTCDGPGPLIYTSPVFAEGVLALFSGYGGPALALRPGGRGDITAQRLWHLTARNPQRIGAPVVVDGLAFILNDPGTVQCFDLRTGEERWNQAERLSKAPSWAAMVATADKRLYVTNHNGETFVLAASPTFELIATNSLGERVLSSIAVSDGDLFIRTYKHLWCIGAGKK
jgi:outer membrane protein assembly factor BamB